MPEANDHELLAQFARENSEAAESAFAALVGRHVALVYSVALRRVGNPHAAEEITQAVFIILARKAKNLSAKTILPGWLHQTARLTAANYLRAEIRRRQHEQEAFMQTILTEAENSASDEIWRQLAPHLDEAIAKLRAKDRDALILRYFENKNLREVGNALGLEERAAQKRVNRAVEKLRHYFSKRGVGLTTAIIAGAISANSVQAAPVGLAKTISVVVIAKGSIATTSTITLVKGTMKAMTWMKMKFALGVGLVALIASGAATVAISQTSDGDKLTAQEIAKQAVDAYAGLSSYNGTGKVISESDGQTTETTFNIRLQRPDFYRIDWTQTGKSINSASPLKMQTMQPAKGIVWNDGSGNYFMMDATNKIDSAKPQKMQTAQLALGAAAGVSSSATAEIPGIFFNQNWGSQLAVISSPRFHVKRLSDEKIAETACYVIEISIDLMEQPHDTNISSAKMTTQFWIGKQDHFIRQIKSTSENAEVTQIKDEDLKINDASLKAILERQGKTATPEAIAAIHAAMEKSIKALQGKKVIRKFILTQTDENISVNQKFSPSDFAP
jgi:RNA polymerase sigma factor (sigma-70 family)